MRRIVQINTVVRGTDIHTVALCDDGSLWMNIGLTESGSMWVDRLSDPAKTWWRLPGVPDGIDGDQISE